MYIVLLCEDAKLKNFMICRDEEVLLPVIGYCDACVSDCDVVARLPKDFFRLELHVDRLAGMEKTDVRWLDDIRHR